MSRIRANINEMKPNYVVIDSVQTMSEPEITSAIGSVLQIRQVTLLNSCESLKSQGVTIFVVGHVTKGGAIAGPKVLEHMVDTTICEGDLHHTYRILRAVKNRFGSTNELGIFEMQEDGLKEVKNPSGNFSARAFKDTTGSAIVVSWKEPGPSS